MNVYLDDIRPAPEGYTLVKTARECLAALEAGGVELLSLDHDLGEVLDPTSLISRYIPSPEDGTWLVRQMIERTLWPTTKPKVHSANPPAAERMRGMIDRYGPYK